MECSGFCFCSSSNRFLGVQRSNKLVGDLQFGVLLIDVL